MEKENKVFETDTQPEVGEFKMVEKELKECIFE